MIHALRSPLCALVLCSALATQLSGQEVRTSMNLEWWHPVVAGAGVAGLFLVDDPVRAFLQDHRSDGLDDVSEFAARFKDQEVFVIIGGGALLLGAAAEYDKVTVTGAHILTSYALSSTIMIGTKWAFGRTRPSGTPGDPTNFDWLDGSDASSFPSGSAAVVFSLATTLADAVDRLPVSIALYSGATLNAWARLNANRHWLSDVALGALFGITTAKLVNGEWAVFGLELPSVWTDGRAAGLQYRLSL